MANGMLRAGAFARISLKILLIIWPRFTLTEASDGQGAPELDSHCIGSAVCWAPMWSQMPCTFLLERVNAQPAGESGALPLMQLT